MAVTSFSIAVGATKQLNLVLTDEGGNPGTLSSGPIYTTDAPTIFSLTPNTTGVAVKALKVGTGKVMSAGVGVSSLTAESDGTVTLPLAVAMSLIPAG